MPLGISDARIAGKPRAARRGQSGCVRDRGRFHRPLRRPPPAGSRQARVPARSPYRRPRRVRAQCRAGQCRHVDTAGRHRGRPRPAGRRAAQPDPGRRAIAGVLPGRSLRHRLPVASRRHPAHGPQRPWPGRPRQPLRAMAAPWCASRTADRRRLPRSHRHRQNRLRAARPPRRHHQPHGLLPWPGPRREVPGRPALRAFARAAPGAPGRRLVRGQ
ncbi:hypothetical protein D3C81_1575870 [compost metagenome]